MSRKQHKENKYEATILVRSVDEAEENREETGPEEYCCEGWSDDGGNPLDHDIHQSPHSRSLNHVHLPSCRLG